MSKKITKKEIKEIDELYDKGISWFLDKMDFDIIDWLDEKDKRRYQELHFKMDSLCVVCGNPEKMFWCDNCESNQEQEGECFNCGHGGGVKYVVVLDEDYHNNC